MIVLLKFWTFLFHIVWNARPGLNNLGNCKWKFLIVILNLLHGFWVFILLGHPIKAGEVLSYPALGSLPYGVTSSSVTSLSILYLPFLPLLTTLLWPPSSLWSFLVHQVGLSSCFRLPVKSHSVPGPQSLFKLLASPETSLLKFSLICIIVYSLRFSDILSRLLKNYV